MEKKLNVSSWLDRCRTCQNGKEHKLFDIVCKLEKGVPCEYIARPVIEIEPVVEEEPKKKRISKATKNHMTNFKKGTKVCPACLEEKPLKEFYVRSRRNGKSTYSYCKECQKSYVQSRQQRRTQLARERRSKQNAEKKV